MYGALGIPVNEMRTYSKYRANNCMKMLATNNLQTDEN